MRVPWCLTLLSLALFVGCNVNVGTTEPTDSPADATSPDEVTPEEVAPEEGAPTEPEPETPEEGPETTVSDPPEEPKTERVKADVGVGKKGRSLDQYDGGTQGVIAGPAKAYFGFREKAVFQIQIPQAMQYFKGAEGRAPKSHEEFMSKIIEANNIKLPELNPRQKYIYDPEKEELMVQRPR
ncbi:MAG: hypothetical protein H8E44_06530 [Planctomycetes bacterium]|nr:hypothetical protein [Planctomycetota bacterium]MBL7037434.1 hypothetical protein [Pirellulaceae bacterium]